MSITTPIGGLRVADLSTGIRVPYLEQGDPSGPAVVLLHGYTDSSPSFRELLSHLPGSVHALAPTQRGHGDADRPEGGYALDSLSNDVAAFLDATGVREAVLVGHSGGSHIAQRFAIDHPDRTRGVVLIGAFHSFTANPGVAELHDEVSALTDPVDRSFAQGFQESTLARPIPVDVLDRAVDESCKLPARVWQATLDGLLADAAPADTGTIAASALLIWGELDAFVPRSDQDGVLDAIPGARLTVYAATGHAVHWEQPEEVAAEVAGFVAGLG